MKNEQFTIQKEFIEWVNENLIELSLSAQTSWHIKLENTLFTEESNENNEQFWVQVNPFYKPYTKMFKI
jgi:hypothetical protein